MIDDLNIEKKMIAGHIEGTGMNFQITDSDYLNIKLDSTESIKLMLESIPEMITMYIKSETNASSTKIIISGFDPDTTYHKYEDHYYNHVEFTTDENGNYVYNQDMSEPHIIFIQSRPSTYYLTEGGFSTTATPPYNDPGIGTWDSINRIATLTTDIDQTIEILIDNVTLDGGGYILTGSGTSGIGSGIYLSGRENVTIRNVETTNFAYPIYLYKSSNNIIQDCDVYSNNYGIFLRGDGTSNNIIQNNNIYDNDDIGIYFDTRVSNNTIQFNTIYNNNSIGIFIIYCSNNMIQYNTVYDNKYGILIDSLDSINNTVINNNFVDNTDGNVEDNGTNNKFDYNYWSDHECEVSIGGICNNTYQILGSADNSDKHPLVEALPYTYMSLKMETDNIQNKLEDFNYGLDGINDKLEDLTSGWGAINNKLEDPTSGLNAINNKLNNNSSEINNIKSRVSNLNYKFNTILELLNIESNPTFTTGPVVADKNANSLVVQVLNTTDRCQDITVEVYDIKGMPTKVYTVTFTFDSKSSCSQFEIFEVPPTQYEVVFKGMEVGFYAWTSTRTQNHCESLKYSEFIKANTFRHRELISID